MSSMTMHGVVRGRTVVLNKDAPEIPDGTEVVVVAPRSAQESECVGDLIPGTAAAVLAAIQSEPHLSAEDMDALNRSLESGRGPMSESPFADFEDAPE